MRHVSLRLLRSWTTKPAACQVEPFVKPLFSITSTSRWPSMPVGDFPDRQQAVEGVVLAFDGLGNDQPVAAHMGLVGTDRCQPRGGGIVAIGVLPEIGKHGGAQG